MRATDSSNERIRTLWQEVRRAVHRRAVEGPAAQSELDRAFAEFVSRCTPAVWTEFIGGEPR